MTTNYVIRQLTKEDKAGKTIVKRFATQKEQLAAMRAIAEEARAKGMVVAEDNKTVRIWHPKHLFSWPVEYYMTDMVW